MSKFKIGDHVRVTQPTAYWFDQTGVVADLEPGGKYPVFVDLDNGGQVAFTEHELILADVVKDAGIDHGADCPLCAPEPFAAVSKFATFTSEKTSLDFEEAVALSNAAIIAANNAEFEATLKSQRAEAVNHPAHYGGDTTYEVIKVAEAWGLDKDAYLFNVIKYVARAGKKGAALQDLKKGAFYLARRIADMESTGAP